jgi:hypothetical protein
MANASKTFITLNDKSKVLVKEVTNEDSIGRRFKIKIEDENGVESSWLFEGESFSFSNAIERTKESGWINDKDEKDINEWGKSIGVL